MVDGLWTRLKSRRGITQKKRGREISLRGDAQKLSEYGKGFKKLTY